MANKVYEYQATRIDDPPIELQIGDILKVKDIGCGVPSQETRYLLVLMHSNTGRKIFDYVDLSTGARWRSSGMSGADNFTESMRKKFGKLVLGETVLRDSEITIRGGE